jgi:two-component system response regulator RegA
MTSSANNILLVDDDEVFRSRLQRAISERGYACAGAQSAEEALKILSSAAAPSHIVLDLKMPGQGGLWLLKQIAQLGLKVKVLVLTGYGSIATAVDAVKFGAVNYLSKPTDADAILAALFTIAEFTEAEVVESEQVPSLSRVEWEHINRVLADCDGNVSKASKLLGLHRRSLQRKLAKMPQ